MLDGIGGGGWATRSFVNAFGVIADECMLLYPDNNESVRAFINENVELKPIKNTCSNIKKLLNIYLGKLNWYSDVLFQIIDDYKPDIIVFDNSRASARLIKQVKKIGVKIVTIHHNYEIEYYRGSKVNILYRYPLLYHIRLAEKHALQNSDLNLTLTKEDMELFNNNYTGINKNKLAVIGVFESSQREKNASKKNIINGELTFVVTGSLSDKQTELSIISFLKIYYPILMEIYPNSKLIIAGKKPATVLKKECSKHSNIELISNPSDMSHIICQADIYLCPISLGGGLKLRVMDGLKFGLPTLLHSVSTRGYDNFKSEGYMYEYDNIETFKTALKKIVNGYFNGNIGRENIIKIYQDNFLFDKGKEKLSRILKEHNII